MLIDTHSHIYSEQFDVDRNETIERAIKSNVKLLLLPSIDKSYNNALINCVKDYPENCYPMIGLHPTSVKENFNIEIDFIKTEITNNNYIAIGETGLDFYWDKTFIKEQEIALREQIELAIKYELPIVLHSRNSLNEILKIIKDYKKSTLNGVFHCFPGNITEANEVVELGFYIGIGGVVTYKNSIMAEVVKNVSINNIVLETDSPYLSPVPYRGKRNESTYINIIAEKIAELKQITINQVEEITTVNAIKLFNLKNEK